MRRMLICLAALAAAGGTALAGDVDPKSLFSEPVALVDAAGGEIMTGKAEGSPIAGDFDGDGVNDLILGGHLNMNTASGGIWLARNVGTNAAPKFDWKNAWKVQVEGGGGMDVKCGCKSSGYVPVHPVDWNGDGWMDLVYSDTYVRSYLLINTKASREKPVFERRTYFDFEKRNHGMNSGGGDWDGDGIHDFLYMPFGGGHYRLFRGTMADGAKFPKYLDGPRKSGTVLKISGTKSRDCAWAWDFSGHRTPGRIEYVGVGDRSAGTIDFFVVENGVSRRVGNLAKFRGTYPKLTVCDLNGDGSADVMYSGGVFAKFDITKVYVMYGKVKNMPGHAPQAAASAAVARREPAKARSGAEAVPAAGAARPKPKAVEAVEAPAGFGVIHMRSGQKVVAKNIVPCSRRVCYETPDGRKRSVNFSAVLKIERPR